MVRRWLSSLIVGTLCFFLAGCAQIDSPEGDIHLTLWQGIGPPSNRAVFQSLVRQFNDTHPEITVESLYIGPPDQQIPKILTAVVGDAMPELLWYLPTLTGQLIELEAIQPLDDWWANTPYRNQVVPSLRETMQLEDHIWSVPFATNNAAIFYRPSLFEKAAITQIPQTWEALRQAANQLTLDTNGDGQIDQHGMLLSFGKGEWTVFCWLPFLYSAGGHLVENGKPDLENEGAIATLKFAADLVQDQAILLSAPEQGYDLEPFLSGKVAMQITGPWVLPQLQAAGLDFGVFPFPIATQATAVLGGENFFLSPTSPEKTRAAQTFLDYILSPEFQLPWALETGYLPANQTVINQPEYQQYLTQNPSMQVFLDQMQVARSRPLLAKYHALSENWGQAIEATLLGLDPDQALHQAQEKIDLIFDHH